MTAGVVKHDAMTAALERARTHHHVAARGAEPVQADDRRAGAVVVELDRARSTANLAFHCTGS